MCCRRRRRRCRRTVSQLFHSQRELRCMPFYVPVITLGDWKYMYTILFDTHAIMSSQADGFDIAGANVLFK